MKRDLGWVDLVFMAIASVCVLLLLLLFHSKIVPSPETMKPFPPLVVETYKYEITFDERVNKDEAKQLVEFAINSMDEIIVETKEGNVWLIRIKTFRYPSVIEKQLKSCPFIKTLTRIEE